MARGMRKRSPDHEFELEEWYSSEDAKRRLGPICRALDKNGGKVGLMGDSDRPYLILEDADAIEMSEDEEELTIDEAKAEWSSITAAALFFGTRFRIHGGKMPRAVLYRNPKRSHPAFKYRRRPQSPDLARITTKLSEILKYIQKLGRNEEKHAKLLTDVLCRLEKAADVIERRFREAWRKAGNLPVQLHA